MELDIYHIAVAILAGLIGGVVSEIGGAGSLISLPMLIGMGLSPSYANGTNRIGVMFQYTSGYVRYLTRRPVPHRQAIVLSIPLVIGTVAGAYFAVSIAGAIFNWIFICVMILTVLFTFFSQDFTDQPNSTDDPISRSKLLDYLIFVVVGLYCGMIQAGMSYLIYYVLVRRMQTTTRTAEAIKTYMSMIVTPFALGVFIWFGHIDWNVAAAIAVGGGLGGWLGSRIVERHSSHSVKDWFIAALIISIVYMLIFVQLHFDEGIYYL